MITLAEQLVEEKVRSNLLGHKCPTHINGAAGIYLQGQVENILGIKISNGLIDIVAAGIKLELKSRKEGSDSAFSIGTMTETDIVNTPNWYDTRIHEKMLKILLITTAGTEKDKDDNVVKSVRIYDFSDKPEIQDLLEDAYTNSRDEIILNQKKSWSGYCPSAGYIAFFERQPSNSYLFRFNESRLQSLLKMGNSNFNQLFEYDI